jgi:hypothetical protein
MINNTVDFSEVLEPFRAHKVMTIEQLSTLLGISPRNTHNHLKKWNVITSYNKNGRYYVLPDIPKFDAHGLWSINDIYFSKHGNLKITVIHLVDTSEMGLDAMEIGKLLKLNPRSFLSHFGQSPDLRREKIAGHFVYFSRQVARFENQLKERLEYTEVTTSSLLSDTVGIRVLVEKIHYPKLSLEQLAKRLQNQAAPVTPKKIRAFFLRHGVLKKTPDSVSS